MWSKRYWLLQMLMVLVLVALDLAVWIAAVACAAASVRPLVEVISVKLISDARVLASESNFFQSIQLIDFRELVGIG